MTQSELEKWVTETLRGEDHWYRIGLSEGKHLGFKHAIEVLKTLQALTRLYTEMDIYQPAIHALKQHAEGDE